MQVCVHVCFFRMDSLFRWRSCLVTFVSLNLQPDLGNWSAPFASSWSWPQAHYSVFRSRLQMVASCFIFILLWPLRVPLSLFICIPSQPLTSSSLPWAFNYSANDFISNSLPLLREGPYRTRLHPTLLLAATKRCGSSTQPLIPFPVTTGPACQILPSTLCAKQLFVRLSLGLGSSRPKSSRWSFKLLNHKISVL